MKESELLSYAITCLKKSGLVWWRVTNAPSLFTRAGKTMFRPSPIKGFPDLAGVFPSGKFWAIELKATKGRLSPEQTDWITRLNMSGAMAVVLRSKEEISEFIAAAVHVKK
jgi:hypothetical protein